MGPMARLAVGVALGWGVFGGAGTAAAQDYGAPAQDGGAGVAASPYSSPYYMGGQYLNPALSPYAVAAGLAPPITSRDALWYMMARQQASGGIGSGQISGSRPARQPYTRRGAPARAPVPTPAPASDRLRRYFGNNPYAGPRAFRQGTGRYFGQGTAQYFNQADPN